MSEYKKSVKRKKVTKKKKINKKKVKMNEINLYIFYTVLALVAIGVLMVFSASSYYALYENDNVFFFLRKELFWALVGLVVFYKVIKIDYHKYKFWIPIGYGVTIILLIAVLFSKPINGATRWLDIAGFSFQPSELAKYMTVFTLAWVIEKRGKIDVGFIKGPIFYIGLAAILAVLVFVENNLSITAIIMFVAFILVFISGLKLKEGLAIVSIGGVLGVAAMILEPYRFARFNNFWDPFKDAAGDGYQLVHSFYALGSGGLFGVGLGNSKQKALYMPEPHNDFIFSIIGEELGLIGCTIVIILFIILVLQGLNVAARAKDKYGRLLATGIVSVIGIQAIINIAVVTGLMPVTGVPLPFISYGGTSLVFNLAAMGVLLNISSQCRDVIPKIKPKEIEIKEKNNIYNFNK